MPASPLSLGPKMSFLTSFEAKSRIAKVNQCQSASEEKKRTAFQLALFNGPPTSHFRFGFNPYGKTSGALGPRKPPGGGGGPMP
jgi:hypothetical protein